MWAAHLFALCISHKMKTRMFQLSNNFITYFNFRTSLASIFKNPASGEKSENETLKYTPPVPKPAQSPPDNQEETKRKFENIFSCVFDAFLW